MQPQCTSEHLPSYYYIPAGLHTGFRAGGQIELSKILGGGGNEIGECIGVQRLGGGVL